MNGALLKQPRTLKNLAITLPSNFKRYSVAYKAYYKTIRQQQEPHLPPPSLKVSDGLQGIPLSNKTLWNSSKYSLTLSNTTSGQNHQHGSESCTRARVLISSNASDVGTDGPNRFRSTTCHSRSNPMMHHLVKHVSFRTSRLHSSSSCLQK